jgi:hypothetical protein
MLVESKGKVKIFSSGKYFNLCTRKNGKYVAKNAVLISVDEVFDLDKVKGISI